VQTARKWSLDGWRGGIGGTTHFDEFTDARVISGLLRSERADLVLQDMNFSRDTSGREGLDLLRTIRDEHGAVPVILITAWGSIGLAVEGIKAGANDFLTKPWSNAHLMQSIETVLSLAGSGGTTTSRRIPRRSELDAAHDFGALIGEDPEFLRVLDLVGRVAPTEASVLIVGESGTGKELVAEAIHRNSKRSERPFVKVNLGLESMAEGTNGLAAIPWKLHLYMNWSHSIEQIYSGNVLDMGPWMHAGLPAGRTGVVSALEPVHAFMFCGIDGEVSNTSSVLAWNERGYHEVFRAWEPDRRVQFLKWQACPGTRARLWMSVDGDIVVQEWPKFTLNSLNDSTFVYHHECYVTQATIDMSARNIRKLFKELALQSENLEQGIEVIIRYQVDGEIGGTVWNEIAGTYATSPYEERAIDQGDRKQIRLQYIGRTDDADVPPVILTPILEAFARTPGKYQWAIVTETDSYATTEMGVRDPDPDEFLEFLEEAAQQAQELKLTSILKRLDDKAVIVELPRGSIASVDPDGRWTGQVEFLIREA